MQIERKNTYISEKAQKNDEITSLNHSSWTLKEITGLKACVFPQKSNFPDRAYWDKRYHTRVRDKAYGAFLFKSALFLPNTRNANMGKVHFKTSTEKVPVRDYGTKIKKNVQLREIAFGCFVLVYPSYCNSRAKRAPKIFETKLMG